MLQKWIWWVFSFEMCPFLCVIYFFSWHFVGTQALASILVFETHPPFFAHTFLPWYPVGSHRVSWKKIQEGALRHVLRPVLGLPSCRGPYIDKASTPMATLYTKAAPLPPTHHNDSIHFGSWKPTIEAHCLQLASIISLPLLVQRKRHERTLYYLHYKRKS